MLLRKTQAQRRSWRRAAFTLMELLVVMAIIVIIGGFGIYFVFGRLDDAKITETIVKARAIAEGLKTYKTNEGEYPENLTALIERSPSGRQPILTNREALLDPWGQPFQVDFSGQRGLASGNVVTLPDVYTRMPDGTRDICNWDKK